MDLNHHLSGETCQFEAWRSCGFVLNDGWGWALGFGTSWCVAQTCEVNQYNLCHEPLHVGLFERTKQELHTQICSVRIYVQAQWGEVSLIV